MPRGDEGLAERLRQLADSIEEQRATLKEGEVPGVSLDSLDDAIRRAVDNARQPHGTWLRVVRINVLSVDDPDVGAYSVIVTPGAG